MSLIHTGNVVPEITKEEHSHIAGVPGKRAFIFDDSGNQITNFGGLATVSIDGTINSIATIANANAIGLATVNVNGTVPATQSGTWNINAVTTLPEVNSLTTILNPSAIGLATVNVNGTVSAAQSGTWDIGTVTTITNDVNIADGGNSITVDDGGSTLSIDGTVAATQSGTWDIGTVTTLPEVNSLTTILNAGSIGLATVNVNGTVQAAQSGTWNIGTLTGITNDVNIADGGNTITVDGTVAATQSGTWDIGTVTTLPVVNSLTTILNPTAIGLATVNINGTVAATQSGTWNIGTLTGITNDVNIADGGNTITVDGTVTANLGATDNTLLDGIAGLVPAGYDYVSLSYTGDNLTGVVFKTGGSGGSTVATLTLAYTGSQLDSVTKS
jgi:hypothetical protein